MTNKQPIFVPVIDTMYAKLLDILSSESPNRYEIDVKNKDKIIIRDKESLYFSDVAYRHTDNRLLWESSYEIRIDYFKMVFPNLKMPESLFEVNK